MLGVEFENNQNITFLIYNEGIFFQGKRFSLDCPLKQTICLKAYTPSYFESPLNSNDYIAWTC